MGANGSAFLQVNFSRSNPFYFPGEQVSGNISFRNESKKLSLKKIFVKLVGELGYSTQETRSSTDFDGRYTTESYTKHNHIPFLSLRTPLTESTDVAHKMVLDRGIYTWPFQFRLSDNLPPSSSPNSKAYPYIKYYIEILIEKPWYKSNIHHTSLFTVSSHVHLSHINDVQQTLYFGQQNRKQLRLTGYLLTRSITPGQSLCFQLNLKNPEQTMIKKIKATFVQHRKTDSDSCQNIILSVNLPDIIEFNGPNFQRNFNLVLPSDYLTPTHTSKRSNDSYPCSFSVYYELKLKVKTKRIFSRFEVTVPIIVGTQPTVGHSDFNMSTNSNPYCNANGLPFSYKPMIDCEK